MGLGAWPVIWLRMHRRRRMQSVLLSLGLGIGLMGLLVLALGLAGALNRVSAWGLLGAGLVAGAARLTRPARGASALESTPAPPVPGESISILQALLRTLALCALVPSCFVAALGACLPPGLLWSEEGGGYDVLEYHLQAPREYYDAGRIAFLPHNVYASFPQQIEMLYLLQMHLAGSPHDAAIPSQLLHAALGALAVAAVAAWAPPGWPAIVSTVAMGAVPWLPYLGCLAYVENGVLFFATLSAALLIENAIACRARKIRPTTSPTADERPNDPASGSGVTIHVTAGLLAGLAAGCKYPAAAMVAAALTLCAAVSAPRDWRRPFVAAAAFALAAAAAFSPWLLRNWAFSGNPVYPFAYHTLGGAAWSDAQSRQWNAAHRLKELDVYPDARWLVARRELLLTGMFGLAIYVAGLAGVFGVAPRSAALLLLWAAIILGVWSAFTHMPGRFAVPLVVPLALLAQGVPQLRPRGLAALATLLVCLAALDSGVNLVNSLRMEELRRGVPFAAAVGETRELVEGYYVNQAVPPDGFVWIVGDAAVFYADRRLHYTVPFNRDPWVAFAETHDDPHACLDWLRSRGVTHVVFSWAEIRRLAGTYGFSPRVTPEWTERLAAAGLRRTVSSSAPSGTLWAEICEVPP